MNTHSTYIIFELAGSFYGVRSEDVHHVDMLEHVTPVPNAAPAVAGVVFSRGQVIPAIDLRIRFGQPRAEPTARTRLIFLRSNNRVVALIVDAAREFHSIPPSAIRPVEDELHGIQGRHVSGLATVSDRLILLLDVAAVIAVDDDAGLIPTPKQPAKSQAL